MRGKNAPFRIRLLGIILFESVDITWRRQKEGDVETRFIDLTQCRNIHTNTIDTQSYCSTDIAQCNTAIQFYGDSAIPFIMSSNRSFKVILSSGSRVFMVIPHFSTHL